MRQHLPGELIQQRYRIESVLGQGGNAIAYKAFDIEGDRPVALKAMSLQYLKNWKQLELFEREVETLKNLNHPQIPKYLDFFTVEIPDDRFFYLVQELADGKSFAELVESGWRTNESGIKEIAGQALEILEYLHNQNPPVIHRDIKPNNLILSDDNQVYLIDFGAVQNIHQTTSTNSNTVIGTFGYMAPEQYRGKSVPATDLYALGATLIYLLTHRPPTEIVTENLRLNFRHHINLSAAFALWLEKLLAPDLENRFDSAHQASEELTQKSFIFAQTKKAKKWRQIVKWGVAIGLPIIIGNYFKYPILSMLNLVPFEVFEAASEGNIKAVEDYLNKGIHVNAKGTQKQTSLLHQAATYEMTEFLIQKGADVNALDMHYFTPLHYARTKEIAQLLISNGADLNSDNWESISTDIRQNTFLANQISLPAGSPFTYGTPLHYTSFPEVAEVLIHNGANLKQTNFIGHYPIHAASILCRQKLINVFVKNGVDINLKTPKRYNQKTKKQEGETSEEASLHLATRCWINKEKRFDVIEFLLSHGADPNSKDKEGKTPINTVLQSTDDIYNDEDKPQKIDELNSIVALLLSYGANANIPDYKGETPLLYSNDIKTTKLLIENGADYRILGDNGNSLLHKSVKHNLIDNTKYLLTLNIDINSRNDKGQTALHLAQNIQMIDLLLENGANINAQDKNGNTRLHYPFLSSVVHYLIENGSDITIKNDNGKLASNVHQVLTEEQALKLLEHGANSYDVDPQYENNLLHKAARNNWQRLAELLIQEGIDPHQKNKWGQSALDLAQELKLDEMVNILSSG